MPSSHLVLCRPLLLLPPDPPSMPSFKVVVKIKRKNSFKKSCLGNSLVVQWLRLQASDAGGIGLTPGRGMKVPTCCVAKTEKNCRWSHWGPPSLCPHHPGDEAVWSLWLHSHTFSPHCTCAQLLTRVQLCDPMDYSQSGSPSHGTLQARILEGVVISFSRGSF